MTINWKDAVSTVLVSAVGVVAYAKYKDFDWPLINSWRGAVLALLVLGLGACVVIGSENLSINKDTWITVASGLGILAFILVFAGLVFGSEVIFYAIVADIFVLWLLTTTHRLVAAKG